MTRTILLIIGLLLQSSFAFGVELNVFAASSLTGSLKEIAAEYERLHPDTSIRLHFAGSQALATQISLGAPADLFISANRPAMEKLLAEDLAVSSRIIAYNHLAVAVSPHLDPQPTSLTDLTRPNLLLAIGNPQVPIGRYTRDLFTRLEKDPLFGLQVVTALQRNIVSEENQVKAIVAKLVLGEADAGIVYQSDLLDTPLQQLPLPAALNPRASYPAAIIRGGQEKTAATFLAYLQNKGQTILARHGLDPVGEPK